MQKKPALWLTFILSGLLVLITACGSNTPFSNSSATPTVPVGENIYVLDGYNPLATTSAGQHIVAFHPGDANPAALVSLPTGLTSMDHQRLYTSTAHNGQTTISVVNTQSGTTIRSMIINGTYTINGQSFSAAVVSFNGQWLALRQSGQSANETTIALVDTQAGKLVKTIHLNGNFDLDAVNPGGSRIYLIERLNDATGHYYVRLYNVAENELYQAPIADKSEINDPRMTGLALTRQMSLDGRFAYTLYIDTFHNVAFVHILPLSDELYFARCLNLPVGKSADLLHYYTLTLSSDGSTLYAANGALGVVSKISLDSGVIFNDQMEATKHINPGNLNTSSRNTHLLHNGAVLSAGDGILYFVGMHGVWSVNTSDLNVRGHYLTQQALTGIALSADNRTLYAVDPAHGITLLNAATGQPQQDIQGPVHNPWGIEWITN